MDHDLAQKYKTLQNYLRDLTDVAIAYSGGVDSTFLLHTARDVCGQTHVLALMAQGTFLSPRERETALDNAQKMGVIPLVVNADEYSVPEFCANLPDRCYYCKKNLFIKMKTAAAARGFFNLADGTNADDTGDYRPGLRALKELGIHSPLAFSGLGKDEIRQLSSISSLPTADQPSRACLASRIPYGTPITAALLTAVGQAEDYFMERGFGVVRLRAHGPVALIEVPTQDFERLLSIKNEICSYVKTLGFTYVGLDVEGFRSGSQNEVLESETGSR